MFDKKQEIAKLKSILKMQRVTQKDISHLLGVTQAAVNYKINNLTLTYVELSMIMDLCGYEVLVVPKKLELPTDNGIIGHKKIADSLDYGIDQEPKKTAVHNYEI